MVAPRWAPAIPCPEAALPRRPADQASSKDATDRFFRCTAWRSVAENAAHTLKKGMRIFVAGKLVQRTFEVEGQKRQTIEIQVTHVGPDLQFQSASVGPRSSAVTSAAEKQGA